MLQIEQGKVYFTLLGDFMKNGGNTDTILKIPRKPNTQRQ
jgi:hypothetical protein